MADSPCVIGRNIRIKGNLTGSEDLMVEGDIEGIVSIKNHLTIQETGEITADIKAGSLEAHGKISGNIDVDDLVSISSVACVSANITAPRIVIEDGARFNGSVDMNVDLPSDI